MTDAARREALLNQLAALRANEATLSARIFELSRMESDLREQSKKVRDELDTLENADFRRRVDALTEAA